MIPNGLLNSRLWHYASSTGTSFVCLLFGFVSGIITARILGPVGRGELAVIAYFPTMIGTIFGMGLPEALGFLVNNQKQDRQDIAVAGLQVSLAIGCLGSLVLAFFSFLWLGEEYEYLHRKVIISCLFAPPMAVNAVIYCLFRNIEKINRVNQSLLWVAGAYVVAVLCLGVLDVDNAFVFNLTALAIQMAIMAINLYLIRDYGLLGKRPFSFYRIYLKQALWFSLPAFAAVFFSLADRTLLIKLTIAEQIGFYAVAMAVVHPLSLAIESFAHIGFVEVAEAEKRERKLQIATSRFQVAQLVLVVAGAFLILIIPLLIKYGFGEEFIPALQICYWLIPAIGLRSLARVLDFMLRAMGYRMPATLSNLVGLVILVGGALYLFAVDDAAGFARVLSFAYLASLLVLLCWVKITGAIRVRDLWGIRWSTLEQVVFKVKQAFCEED